ISVVGAAQAPGEMRPDIGAIPVEQRRRSRGGNRRQIGGAGRKVCRPTEPPRPLLITSSWCPPVNDAFDPTDESTDINRHAGCKSNMQATPRTRLEFARVRRATPVFDRSKLELE